MWFGYISAQKLENARSKSFAMSIWLQTKAISNPAQSPGLENIPQLPGKRAKVGQNQDARNAVSAILSVFKWSGAIFRPTSSKVSVRKVLQCPFHCKRRPSGVNLESTGVENIPQLRVNWAKVSENHDARKAVSRYSFSPKVKWGYISAQKLESQL